MHCKYPCYWLVVVAVLPWLGFTVSRVEAATPTQDPRATLIDSIEQRAKLLAAEPILRRPYEVDEIIPKWIDTRAAGLENNRRKWFALSMSDFFYTNRLVQDLPLMATAAHTSGDPKLRKRVLEQLTEMTTWSPLNRPGWDLYRPGPTVPDDYNDGNWLGTGVGVRTITESLQSLGDQVPDELRTKLHALLLAEVNSVQDDFNTQRIWYWNTPACNQFALPNTGVALACLELGKDRHAAAYEFAVKNLLRTLDAQGSDGANHEGPLYGAFTNQEILYVARAMADADDRRLIDHPHFANFGKWLIHMIQPGEQVVNFFDGTDRVVFWEPKPHRTGIDYKNTKLGETVMNCLMLLALANEKPELRAFQQQTFPKLQPNALALDYLEWSARQPAITTPLITYAAYESSPLVTWRSSWAEDADGVWVRGGSTLDGHDHCDHGHVNYIVGGREVLIESGSTDYAKIAKQPALYQGGLAHNVLQIGTAREGVQRRGQGAAIAVQRLDSTGGDVTVDASTDYDSQRLRSWKRHVVWDQAGLNVVDVVALQPDMPDTLLFRWHLASEYPLTITPSDGEKSYVVGWLDGKLTLRADVPFNVTSETMPHGITYVQQGTHTCLLVQTQESVSGMHLTTDLRRADCLPQAADKTIQTSP